MFASDLTRNRGGIGQSKYCLSQAAALSTDHCITSQSLFAVAEPQVQCLALKSQVLLAPKCSLAVPVCPKICLMPVRHRRDLGSEFSTALGQCFVNDSIMFLLGFDQEFELFGREEPHLFCEFTKQYLAVLLFVAYPNHLFGGE